MLSLPSLAHDRNRVSAMKESEVDGNWDSIWGKEISLT